MTSDTAASENDVPPREHSVAEGSIREPSADPSALHAAIHLQCDIIAHNMAHSRTPGLARTNVTLPATLLEEVDRFAGPRGRSRYVAEAVAQRVRRDALGAAIRETAGAMVGKPGWMSPDEVARWVDDLRAEETD